MKLNSVNAAAEQPTMEENAPLDSADQHYRQNNFF